MDYQLLYFGRDVQANLQVYTGLMFDVMQRMAMAKVNDRLHLPHSIELETFVLDGCLHSWPSGVDDEDALAVEIRGESPCQRG